MVSRNVCIILSERQYVLYERKCVYTHIYVREYIIKVECGERCERVPALSEDFSMNDTSRRRRPRVNLSARSLSIVYAYGMKENIY